MLGGVDVADADRSRSSQTTATAVQRNDSGPGSSDRGSTLIRLRKLHQTASSINQFNINQFNSNLAAREPDSK